MRFRNIHNFPNQDIEYVFPRKYVSATVHGKGVDLTYPTKPLRQPLTKPNQYYPIKTIDYNPYKHEFGFTSRDTEYTLPGKSIYGVSGKGSDLTGTGKSGDYTFTSKDEDYPTGKSNLRVYKGYVSGKEDYAVTGKAGEFTTRKPSESVYPKKVLDHGLSPRKYSYFVNHKY